MFCPEVDDAAVDYTLKFNKATTDTNRYIPTLYNSFETHCFNNQVQ